MLSSIKSLYAPASPQSGLVAHATKHLVANVDANADAVVNFMHAKSIIGSMHATGEKLADVGNA